MFTKTITPTIMPHSTNPQKKECVGTVIEYRLFGLLLYKKTLISPLYYGVAEYEFYSSI